MLERVHKDIGVFDFNGKNVPRIILTDRRFDEIMSKIQGKPVSISTDLNKEGRHKRGDYSYQSY